MKIPKILLSCALGALVAFTAVPAFAEPAFATRNVNIRSGPGLNFDVVDRLVEAEPVDKGNCNSDGSWCYIRHEGTNGWVAAVFLSPTLPGQQPPTPPPNQPPPSTEPPPNSPTSAYRATSSVNVRSGPDIRFSIVDRLDSGELVTRGDCSADGTWCYISHDGADGWVSASLLIPARTTPPPPPPPPPGTPSTGPTLVANSSVNVRSGAGTNFSVVDRLEAGERVVLGQCLPDNSWCYINHTGPDGWVATRFLSRPGPGNQGPGNPPPPSTIQKIGTAIAGMPVRAAPTLFTATIGRLEQGDQIPVMSCTDDGYWCHVRNNRIDGWVPAAFLTISDVSVPAPVPSNVAVAAQATPLRQSPGNQSPLIGMVPAGARVNVLQCGPAGNWCQVSYNAMTGWVAAAALKPPTPTPAPPPSQPQPDQVCITGFGGIQFCIGQ